MEKKILLGVLFLFMLSKFNHARTNHIQHSAVSHNDPFRCKTFRPYGGRNEKKYSPMSPNRPNIQEPRMGGSCQTCGVINRKKARPLIIQGDLVLPPYKYPWMVAITDQKNGEILCTGAIISEYFILTASHCLVKNLDKHKVMKPQKIPLEYFRPGDMQISFLTSTSKVRPGPPIEKVIPNTLFKPAVWDHDIGLLKLAERINCGKFANPICLPPPNFIFPKGAKMTIGGFGSYDKSQDSIGKLRQSKVTEERFDRCPFPPRMKKSFYCLKSVKQGQVACYGDSGGPLFYELKNKYFVLGVSSFGKSCDRTLPFLYTSVPHHLQWIHKNMA